MVIMVRSGDRFQPYLETLDNILLDKHSESPVPGTVTATKKRRPCVAQVRLRALHVTPEPPVPSLHLKRAQRWQILSKLGAHACEACDKHLSRLLP